MKNGFTNIVAVLLVLWYSLSVIGFDVHTCSSSGEIYIATVISGTACEDIHPGHDVRACSCCHHHSESHEEEQSVSTKPCCSDDWQVIVLTGVRVSEKQDYSDAYKCGVAPCIIDFHPEYIHSNTDNFGLRAFCKPDPGTLVPLDFQRTYGVWRI